MMNTSFFSRLRGNVRRGASLLLLAALLGGCFPAGAESAAPGAASLRGYSAQEGYVYLLLGRYPQTAAGDVQPILWRVLSVDEEKACLLSEYILFARSMHPDLKEYSTVFKGDFSRTELCHYLNNDFAQAAFTDEEAALLLPFEPFGKVFLISREEMADASLGLGKTLVGSTNPKKILANPGLRAWGTEWAIQNNGYSPEEYPNPKARVTSRNGKRITQQELRLYVFQAKYGACSPYWARSQSTSTKTQATCTKDGGQIGRIEVGRDNEGVRPAVYLAAGTWRLSGGAGTKEDPYLLEPLKEAEASEESETSKASKE